MQIREDSNTTSTHAANPSLRSRISGSPKRPMIPEAEILHYLDVMDARMYDDVKGIRRN